MRTCTLYFDPTRPAQQPDGSFVYGSKHNQHRFTPLHYGERLPARYVVWNINAIAATDEYVSCHCAKNSRTGKETDRVPVSVWVLFAECPDPRRPYNINPDTIRGVQMHYRLAMCLLDCAAVGTTNPHALRRRLDRKRPPWYECEQYTLNSALSVLNNYFNIKPRKTTTRKIEKED